MKKDDEIMTAAEFFGETEGDKGVACASGPCPRKRRAAKTFADIKARMVMRIYGVTREKAEKIVSDRAAVNSHGDAKDCNADEEEIMSAEEFFRA